MPQMGPVGWVYFPFFLIVFVVLMFVLLYSEEMKYIGVEFKDSGGMVSEW